MPRQKKKRPLPPDTHLDEILLNPEKVLNWRTGRLWSQSRVAAFCGISAVTYRRIEHGKRIAILTAARVAKKLGIPFEQLKA